MSKELRNKRSDYVNLTVARTFWHDRCFLDTFSKKKVTTVDGDGNTLFCDTHVQRESTSDLYGKFTESDEYRDWKSEHQTNEYSPKISLTLFKEARCPCIVAEIQHDCADVALVAVEELRRPWAKYRQSAQYKARGKCECAQHQLSGYESVHESLDNLADFLQCDPVPFEDLVATCPGHKYVSSVQAAQLNTEYARNTVGDKRAARASLSSGKKYEPQFKRVKNVSEATTTPHLNPQKRECGHLLCSDCGVSKRMKPTCPADCDSTQFTTVRVFRDVYRGGGSSDGSSGGAGGGTVVGAAEVPQAEERHHQPLSKAGSKRNWWKRQ